jgi:hypothetical protein
MQVFVGDFVRPEYLHYLSQTGECKKTKLMYLNTDRLPVIFVEGKQLDRVDSFNYLGSCITRGCHLSPVLPSVRVVLITQSMAIIKSTDDITHSCFTPDFTRKLVSASELIVHEKFAQKTITHTCKLNGRSLTF